MAKNSFLNKCEEKLRKKLVLPLKNVAKNKRKIFFQIQVPQNYPPIALWHSNKEFHSI